MTTPKGMLFDEPLAKPLSQYGVPLPGAYYLFYTTGGLVPAAVYANGLLTTVLSQTPGQAQPSCTADANGRFNAIYMDPSVTYRVQLYNSSNQLLEDVDPYVVPASLNALIGATGSGTMALSDGTNSTTVTYQYQLSEGGTVCTLAVSSGLITTMASTHLQLNVLTGTIPNITGGGNSYHSIPAENNGAYITAVAQVGFNQNVYLEANPITGLNSWTSGAAAGLPVGFTITYNTAQTMTEH